MIKVYPNPWKALDADGDPCAVVPRDPIGDGGGPGSFVGARIDAARTKMGPELRKGDDLRSRRQTTKFTFLGIASNDPDLSSLLAAAEPVEVPATRYYRDRLLDGSLLPADAETASAVKMRAFTPPAQALAGAKSHATGVRPAPTVSVTVAGVEQPVTNVTFSDSEKPKRTRRTADSPTETPES